MIKMIRQNNYPSIRTQTTKRLKVLDIIWLTICILIATFFIIFLSIPKKIYLTLFKKYKTFANEHKTASEIIRFIICGGIATVIDMFVMGVVMYLMQPNIYDTFLNVFINTPTPSTLSTVIGTGIGFLSGLVVNYVLSILFVFNEKGKSKSTKGFIIFAILSTIGLGINLAGMYIGFDLLGWDQWLVKVIVTIIVLIYNYISKRLLLFKNK